MKKKFISFRCVSDNSASTSEQQLQIEFIFHLSVEEILASICLFTGVLVALYFVLCTKEMVHWHYLLLINKYNHCRLFETIHWLSFFNMKDDGHRFSPISQQSLGEWKYRNPYSPKLHSWNDWLMLQSHQGKQWLKARSTTTVTIKLWP